jgi:hypothetical protein
MYFLTAASVLVDDINTPRYLRRPIPVVSRHHIRRVGTMFGARTGRLVQLEDPAAG